MKAPAFWSRPPGLLARLLQPLAWIYGAVAAGRMSRDGADVGVPVLCIGNFTAGGAGKTPSALLAVQVAGAAGLRPFIVSRGYGGNLQGPVNVDPRRHDADDCGDEPLLLSRFAPVVVARDRAQGAALAVAEGAELIVMDDGMQSRSIRKDTVIAVVDGGAGVGNGLCLPAGPLRAPLGSQIAMVDAVLVIGAGAPGDAVATLAASAGKAVLRGRLVPSGRDVEQLRGRRLLAFAGIGRPEKFFDTLREAGLDLPRTRAFADHHAYRLDEARALLAEAEADGLMPVTTEKDATRWPRGLPPVATLGVTLELEKADRAEFAALVSARTPKAP